MRKENYRYILENWVISSGLQLTDWDLVFLEDEVLTGELGYAKTIILKRKQICKSRFVLHVGDGIFD